jgi:hypothetical protein
MRRMILVGTALVATSAIITFAPAAHAHGSWKKARILACKDKSEGDACSYEKKGTTVQGTCQTSPRKKLICLTSDENGTGGAAPGSSSGGAAPGTEPPPATTP